MTVIECSPKTEAVSLFERIAGTSPERKTLDVSEYLAAWTSRQQAQRWQHEGSKATSSLQQAPSGGGVHPGTSSH